MSCMLLKGKAAAPYEASDWVEGACYSLSKSPCFDKFFEEITNKNTVNSFENWLEESVKERELAAFGDENG